MNWRKNTLDQASDSRHACSRWHDTNFEHPRVPRRERKEAGSWWLLAVPILLATATVVLIVKGVLRG
jgi:hypothetical protein